jgi:hypothetical protein
MTRVRGVPQFVVYGSSSSPIWYTLTDDEGHVVKHEGTIPIPAPTIAIYDQAGNLRASGSMTAETVGRNGMLAYDTQTAEFGIGETLTAVGGTPSTTKTATIMGDLKSGVTGILQLGNIDGTILDNDVLTDSGTGAAVANGGAYTGRYYYAVDASTVGNYPIARHYRAEISYITGGVTVKRLCYFDVAYYPMTAPMVTSEDVVTRCPAWIASKPAAWEDWTPAVLAAYAELIEIIYDARDQVSDYVRREDQMFQLLLALVRCEISRSIGLPQEERSYWENRWNALWASRHQFTTITPDPDGTVDTDDVNDAPIIGGFTR